MSLPAQEFHEVDRTAVLSVHQGDCQVSADPETTFSTILGSCISACIRDVVTGFGGMNHFLLAEPSGTAFHRFGASARYGAFAMEDLINKVLVGGTGAKSNLMIKIFGGGKITPALDDVGAKNVAFVREYLAADGFQIEAEDLGGTWARRVLFTPASGKVFCKRLDSAAGQSVVLKELAFAGRPPRPASMSDIELF